MLSEIYCEQFHQRKISFNNGLNVVLGTNTGNNSIGKSSFLLIIDFVFGGDTYADSKDILDNVGFHEIYFKFIFNDEEFSFSRDTKDKNTVWICTSSYSKKEVITKNDYCIWLAKQYSLNLYKLSFRDAVSRYIRVYGKNNYDEKHPLNAIVLEPANNAITALIKLFDCYKVIDELDDQFKQSKATYDIFRKAQSHNFVAKIGKRQFNNNKKEIKKLTAEIEEISNKLEQSLLDVDSAASEEAIEIKRRLSMVKRMRSNKQSCLETYDENSRCIFPASGTDYLELQKFFPSVDIKHISEVEQFHTKINHIFNEELKEEKRNTEREIQEYNDIIQALENKLRELIHNPNLSKIILQKHAYMLSEIKRMENENKSFIQSYELQNQKKTDEIRLKKVKEEQLSTIENTINVKMNKINDTLYTEKHNPPILHLTNNSYSFFTPNDTGTGIAFKSLVVFDLSVLHLTNLPILVHDSLILKQISDDAIETILEQYKKCNKQVFISLDKQDSYSSETSKILNEHAVLRLSEGGEELFGRSWGKQNY